MKKMLIVVAALMLMLGCTDYEGDADGYNFNGGVFLFNGKDDVGTLSVVDKNGLIHQNVQSLGKWPNHINEYEGMLYVVNSGNNNVQQIDAETAENTGSIELTALSNPMRVAIAERKLYATNTYGTGIDVYDFDKDSLYTIAIKGVPDSCMNGGTDAVIANGNKVYAGVRNVTYESYSAIYGNEFIVVIDAEADTVLTSFEAGLNIADMLINEENELHILSTGNRNNIGGFVRVYDLTAINYNSFSTVDLGSQPGSFALNSEGMVYVAVSGLNVDWTGFGGIMKYNSVNNEIINGAEDLLYVSASSGILDICVDGFDNIYAPLFDLNELVILDSYGVKSILTTGNGPQGMVFVKEGL